MNDSELPTKKQQELRMELRNSLTGLVGEYIDKIHIQDILGELEFSKSSVIFAYGQALLGEDRKEKGFAA